MSWLEEPWFYLALSAPDCLVLITFTFKQVHFQLKVLGQLNEAGVQCSELKYFQLAALTNRLVDLGLCTVGALGRAPSVCCSLPGRGLHGIFYKALYLSLA